ncbi:MAG: NADH-quinone oxidoreductase subunit L [Armatimonadetes bacterium]|nr:NADH-quinone oxidoreductase subunit L [Armatimonadota bacterium]NIO75068.1 NADH-quinone oxidoreductase subunit L [Armatimonadota bacterium]NIO95718.1 NADH-quinone oxidoreductase subunit L [Armatimonadota bacterium]
MLWLIPILPAIAFLVISAFFVNRLRRIAPYVLILALILSLIISFSALSKAPLQGAEEQSLLWLHADDLRLEVGTLLDPLSAIMLVVVCFVSLVVQIYSIGYMAGDEGYGRYFAFMSLFSAAMLGVVISNNLLQTYVCWELVGLCSYLLIGFWYRRPSAAAAAKKAFVVTRFGDVGFLVAVLAFSLVAKEFNFGALQHRLAAGDFTAAFITAVSLLIFCGAVGKSAQFPLHIWLPDAMEGPTPVSALIHAATMVAAGVYLVARTFFLFAASPVALIVVACIGAFTALFAASIAVAANDIKRVLAYSTISQLGYMMLGLGALGYTAAVFHLTTHAFFKALLFLTAGSVIHAIGKQDMWELGGLAKKMPITALTCLAGALALAGIFPFAGFWSKDEILASAWLRGAESPLYYLLFAMGLAAAFLTAFYMFRMWILCFTGTPRTKEAAHAHESPWVMTVPLAVLALLALVSGFWLKQTVPGNGLPFAEFVHAGPAHHGEAVWLMFLSTLVAAAGIVTAYFTYYRAKVSAAAFHSSFPWVRNGMKSKWWVDAAWESFATRVVIAGSSVAAWFDRHVPDGMVNGVAWLCGQAGLKLRPAQSGQVQLYALVAFIGIILFVILLRLTTGW